MNILIIRTTPNIVNLNTYNLQEIGLAKAFVRKGHCCDVMYYGGRASDHIQEIEFDKGKHIKIIWIRGYGAFYEGIYPSLKRYVNEYDIIQVGGYIGITSLWLNRHVQDKTVNYQGLYYCLENKGDIRKAKIMDRLLLPFSNIDNMCVVTKSILATEYIKSKGIKNVTTIGVGLDIDNLMYDSDKLYRNEFIQKIRKEKQNNKYLLYIGAFEERRNIKFLIEIFRKVVNQEPCTKLILIGSGDKEYVDSCFELINKFKLQDKIIYKKRLEQKFLGAIYELSDIFLLPTRYEIFGMVLLEAMYFGLPVITTYNGGSSTLINNNENGIIIREFDSSKWCYKIIECLKDKNLYNNIKENAHITIINGFTWDALANKFLEIYDRRLQCLLR